MRGFVFIDGSNFYHKLKDLTAGRKQEFPLSSFDFHAFATWLSAPGELVGVCYYIGAVRRDGSEKSQALYTDQQRLIGRLQQQGVEIVLGHLIRHPDRSFHKKGVDVRLAVEMIRLAREDRYDQAYLVSSDTDLVPAVEEVHSFAKRVQYVGTRRGQSYGLSKVADDVRLIRSEDVRPFFAPPL